MVLVMNLYVDFVWMLGIDVEGDQLISMDANEIVMEKTGLSMIF